MSFDKTCKFFKNIAFNDRHRSQNTTFRMILDRDCADALAMYQTAKPGTRQHARAEEYLLILQKYRDTLMKMAARRYFIAQGKLVTNTRPGKGTPVSRPISRTGAYLIARSMGLVGVQRDWKAWSEARADLGDQAQYPVE